MLSKKSVTVLRIGLACVFLANALVAYFSPQEFKDLIKDELNVKEIIVDMEIGSAGWLDTNLTPELKAELWRTLEILAAREREDRTLTLLAALVQDPEVRAAHFRDLEEIEGDPARQPRSSG